MDLVDDEIQLPANISLVRLGKPELVNKKKNTLLSHKKGNCNDGQICLSQECIDVLNRILPVKEWEKDGKLYRQRISNEPGTTSDLKKLAAKLDMYLKQFNAKELGVCPIRQQLYFQYFSEIIRQITLNSTLRGRMFVQVRDEMKNNYESHQKLYQSRIAHGIRKFLMCEKKITDLKEASEKLSIENGKIEEELANMIVMTKKFERKAHEAMKVERTRHARQLDDLKKTAMLLVDQIETVINPENNPNSYSYFSMP